MQIRLWSVEGKALHTMKSGHMNNIFSVQFLPCGGDDLLISAAGNQPLGAGHLTNVSLTHMINCVF